MSTVGELSVKVTADTTALKRKIERDSEEAGRNSASKFSKGMKGAGGLLLGLGAGAAVAGGAIAAFGVKAAMANETAMVSFTKLLGSAEKAQGFMKELNDFAAKTPFELPGLREAASKLLATGTAAKDIIPLMTRIGDATSAVGTGQDGINRSVAALQKMQITGKVTAESMNMLSEAGVNATDALAASLGKSPQEIAKMVTKGQVKVEDVFKAIESGAGKSAQRVVGMMDKQSATFAGMISTLKDTVGQGLAQAAVPLMQGLKDALPPITKALEGVITGLGPALGALGPAIGALTPVLAPVAKILGDIASAVLTGLTAALGPLVAALQPILEVFAELGSKVGPLVGTLLGKIGEVLGRLLEALLPILAPLGDLVFTILDAAAPILMVAADLILVLVDAIAPLLAIVGTLLAPLGELVNVLFKAIMPILKPLIPVIEAVATVLADVLGRAIGLIIFAIGNLIQAGAKLAPFILRNVTRPLVDAFLWMAENIVESAATAFSWVPGLGDKLATAKQAVADFKKNASKGITDAADTIEKEGTRIGKGLVDSGIATMKDPMAASRMRTSGTALGTAMTDGMAIGIRNGQVPVQAAATGVAQSAINAAKTTLDSHSPSRVFIKIGGDVVDGFALGLGDMGKVSDKMRSELEAALTASENRINKWVETNKRALDDAVQAWKDYRNEAMSAITGGVNVADAQSAADATVKAADDAYKSLQEAQRGAAGPDASDSDRSRVAEAQAAYDAAKAGITTFEAEFDKLLAQSNLYGNAMSAVSNAIASQFGPNSVGGQLLMQQMMQMGPQAGAQLASQLIGTDGQPTALLGTIVTKLSENNIWAGKVADSMAANAKGSGVLQAEAALAGLEKKIAKEQARLVKVGADMGDGMIIGFKSKQGAFKAEVDAYIEAARKSLDSHSPSRVFIGIGEDVGDGFNIGVGNTLADPFSTLAADAAFMKRVYAPTMAMDGGVLDPTIQVFIGETELTEIVRTEVGSSNDDLARSLTLGRR